MKLSHLATHDEISAQRRDHDPEYAAEVDRLALASAVSAIVVDFRAKHRLTQSELGRLLGWKQPHVARLERGDHVPALETLQRLARHGIVTIVVNEKGTTASPASKRTINRRVQSRRARLKRPLRAGGKRAVASSGAR
ncbi:helix-turn-helix transcriptional regulator [Kribbia dieselivorans]|uniref:helix-turn-helix transcriptional regulator n=1 Tax=Kribbia dieselivorans TaxID=331526 RepID=UPI000A625D01|nr:helix-turn-helix transcriptional regulator [Kribbia dieselivorans]